MIRSLTKKYYVLIFLMTILIYSLYISEELRGGNLLKEQISLVGNQKVKYLINTSQCRITESNPYNEDIIDFLEVKKYSKCSQKNLLTYIDKSKGMVTLNVDESLLREYSFFKINCCYSNITRINYENRVDDQIKFTRCTPFQRSVEIKFPYIKVECFTMFGTVYTNVHATTLIKPSEVKKFPNETKYSVLLFGIDSMSKSNLKRAMPKTYNYAEQNMISMKGYNKIGDNTFPNLMAVLTGYSLDQLNEFCDKNVKMNNCKIIWDNFKDSGYVTAYAEDSCFINTYQYGRLGFSDEPTDYYYTPYFSAAEQLSFTWWGRVTYCSGPETSGERIINAAKDFAVTFKSEPYFGLFWSNSYSHNNVNMPSVMDGPVFKLLSDTEFISSLNNTILIFYSDHGFRFGNIRYTHTGWLEERLPFMYFLVPETFKKSYPDEYDNLLTNKNRLTTPFDVFNTLQDILHLGNRSYTPSWSHGCPRCQSLFTIMAENRTCEDASIEQHWCTCKEHSYINPLDPIAKAASEFVVSEVNNLIKSFPEGSSCLEYVFSKIKIAGVSPLYVNDKNESVNYYLVMFETDPFAVFEATVEAGIDTNRFRLLGKVSRVNWYESVSGCITTDTFLKKYCYCPGIYYKLYSIFDIFRN